MSERKIVLSSQNKSGQPLYVVRFRMPSENQKRLTTEERAKYHRAYFSAWRILSKLGFKDTTSTVLSRRPIRQIEKAIEMAEQAYVVEHLNPPNFTKTSVDIEEEASWLEAATEAARQELKELEQEIEELKDEADKDKRDAKMKRIKRKMQQIQDQITELVGENPLTEEVLSAI
jgi:uncharacterized coiled-coil DUF342 family protein